MNSPTPSLSLFSLLLLLSFEPNPANAMISGATGNKPVENHFWPTGSEGVANLKSRVAHWSGPRLVGDTFEYRAKSSADLNEALAAFAKIAAPKRELILRNGPAESQWLKISPLEENDPLGARIDWSFVVWQPYVWHQNFNNPRSTFGAEYAGFRQPVDPPRIIAYFGAGGKLVWDEIEVPDGITVIDQRGKPGDGPSITGSIFDMRTGKAIEGATVTVSRARDVARDVVLPVTKTDEAGRFVVKGFPEGGACVAIVSHPGYATRTSVDYAPFRGSDTREVTLHLAKVAKISGVVRGTDGAPIGGVRVTVRPMIARDGFGYPGPGGRRDETNAEGRFAIEGLPVGFAGVSAQKTGFSNTAEMTDLYDVPNEEPLEFVMSGTGTVTGTLKVMEGRQASVSIQEVGGLVIGSWGGSMKCQQDGSFEFKNVPPGEYLIGPSRGPHLKAGDANVKKVTVKTGGTVTVEIVEK